MPVRQATVNDLDELVPLFGAYLQFYQVPRLPADVHAFLEARLRQGDSLLLVGEDEQGQAQGFVQLYPYFASLALQPAWLLSDLYVSPEQRRLGLGAALMNAARAHAERSGACGLQLETAHDNLAGQALYERLGYVRDQQFYTYWLGLPER